MKSVFTIAFLLFTIPMFSQHPDYSALKDFYESTGGENWVDNSGWATGVNDANSNPCDGWFGIECNGDNRVEEITLTLNFLSGSIPESIGEITMLERLSLAGNNLGGEIPSSIVGLQFFKYLQLGNNNFGGEIPAFLGDMLSLTHISFPHNNFSGEVPANIGNLSNLNILELSNNNLNGEVFDIIVKLKKLSFLNIPFNEFEGEIPENITDVPNLVGILLAHNNFTGEIPTSWGDKSFYIYFNIGSNNFSGCIPSGFNSFCEDGGVIFDNNPQLPWNGDFDKFCETSGSYSEQEGAPCTRANSTAGLINENCECAGLCDHPDYEGLMAFYSSTKGNSWDKKDGWIDGLNGSNCDPCTWFGVGCNEDNRVISIGLIDNNVRGSIPEEIKMIPFLEQLVLFDNNIGGDIPQGLYELVNLTNLNLDKNNIGGSLSEDLGALTKLKTLSFSRNNFEGSIPIGIKQLTDLEVLSGYNNKLTGKLPIAFTYLTKLTTLNLAYNTLEGQLPGNIGFMSALQNLRLNSNNLSGNIAPTLGDLENLNIVYLQDNKFSGCIDENIYNLCDVPEIRMSNNLGLAWNGDFDQFCASSGSFTDQEGVYCGLGGSGVIDDCECIVSNELCFVYEGILCQEWVQELVNNLNCYDLGFGNKSTFSLALSSFEETPVLVVNESWGFASKVGITNSIYTCDGELLEICSYSLGTNCGDSTTIYSQLIPNPTTFYRCMEDELPDCSMFIQHEDYPALSALYYSTGGLDWNYQNGWREGIQDPFSDPCVDWRGVTCNDINRVESIALESNGLVGELPNEIGDLDQLTFLNFSWNEISGSLPNSIGRLKQLQHLDMRRVNFNAPLNEDIGELDNLEYLNLGSSEMIGPIPESIGNMTKLKYFNIEDNMVVSLPSTITNMVALETLLASNNLIQGQLPINIGDLLNLKIIELSYNKLNGPIPSTIANLSSLSNLEIISNELTGELPVDIGALGNLKVLGLGDNNLSGELPESIVNLNVTTLGLWGNSFSGELPFGIVSMGTLVALSLSDNNFTGNLPDGFINHENFFVLKLEDNNFSGCIPESYQAFCFDFEVQVFLDNNPLLPYEGNFDDYCLDDADQIGAPCDDGDDTNGIDDVIKEDCSCGPKPVSTQNLLVAVTVFPNPTRDVLFIEGYQGGDLSYEIIDLLGRIVSKNQLQSDGQISTADLLNGVYVLKLIDSDTKDQQTIKIVKQ